MKKILGALMFSLAMGAWLMAVAPVGYAEEQVSIGQLFIDAYDLNERKKMEAVIEKHKEGVPLEVRNMVEYALSDQVESKEEQDFLLTMVAEMASIYKDKTGDGRLLAAVEANINQLKEREKKSGGAELEKIKKELTQLGKGEWSVRTIRFEKDGKLKVEIILKEKEASFSNRYVSFKDSKKAKEIVKKYLPDAKGRIDWFSGGMGMKAIIIE